MAIPDPIPAASTPPSVPEKSTVRTPEMPSASTVATAPSTSALGMNFSM